jgi:hypothetical protein
MFDLVKLLIEKRDQRGKFIIVISKISLNIIFASWLYSKIVGPYKVIDVTDFTQWIGYITSGQILVGIFLYLVSDVALYYLLPGLPEYFLNALAKYRETFLTRRDQRFIFIYLSRFELLKYDKASERISWAKNSESFYHFMTEFSKKETKEEIQKYRKSYLNDIFENFLAFALLHFLFFNHYSGWLTALIVISFLLVAIVYIIAVLFLNMIEQHRESILLMLQTLKEEQTVHDLIQTAGIYLRPVEERLKGVYFDQFVCQGKEYYLAFIPYPKRIKARGIQRLAQYAIEKNKKILVVTNVIPEEEVVRTAVSHKDDVILIGYKSQDELTEKIRNFLSTSEINS